MNILITGASKGIGAELVKQFAANPNNNIVALARSADLLQQLKQTCKEQFNNVIHIYSIDFLSDNFTQELAKLIELHNYHFDIVVNNAGILFNEPFTTSTQSIIQQTFQVNYTAPLEIIKSVITHTDKSKICHVVNIGSMGGFQGSIKFPGLAIYSSSKAALANLTECLAEEYKATNIKFNCLALGSVQTEMLTKALPDYQAQALPEQMAAFIADFAINGHQYYNGKILPVSSSTP